MTWSTLIVSPPLRTHQSVPSIKTMKQSTKLWLCAGLCLTVAVVITHATMGGQYSVNIHFVPPLVTGTCGIAQFWSPPNVSCALCFCITGSLSRCIPQPGCSPANVTTNATTTTPPPAPQGNVQPSTETNTVTPAPAAQDATTPAATVTPAPTPAPGPPAPEEVTTLPPANLVRKRRGNGRIVRKTKNKF